MQVLRVWPLPKSSISGMLLYFFVVESALLLRTMAGRDWAKRCNSGSSRFFSKGQTPADITSTRIEKKRNSLMIVLVINGQHAG